MALTPAIRAAVARVDRDRPVTQVRTLGAIAAGATARPRFRAALVGGPAAFVVPVWRRAAGPIDVRISRAAADDPPGVVGDDDIERTVAVEIRKCAIRWSNPSRR
jgi:hypothetical protein